MLYNDFPGDVNSCDIDNPELWNHFCTFWREKYYGVSVPDWTEAEVVQYLDWFQSINKGS